MIKESPEDTITALDRQFARLMVELNGAPHEELQRAAELVSARRAEGHICIELGTAVVHSLLRTQVVGRPGETMPLIADDAGRLYLQRYWAYENQLAEDIARRIAAPALAVDEAYLAATLDRLIGRAPASADQRRAAETAVRRSFCVITGGPGTGKTRTVAVILALLGPGLRVALAAPTGKAAARLTESIHHTLAAFPGTDFAPPEASTIHRLLGSRHDSPYFRHDRARPLAVDAVIIDEASMVDLALMAKLFDAIPPTARLILLGDKDQLASVEAGYVLGDICRAGGGHIVELWRNFRFGETSGIHRFSQAVNTGDADPAIALLKSGAPDLRCQLLPEPGKLAAKLRDAVLESWREALSTDDPSTALRAMAQFCILCALRRGPYGVENLNRLAQQILADAGLIAPSGTLWRGRPIMILENAPALRLYNGDTGIFLPDADGRLRAFFAGAGDGSDVRSFAPARLPRHETVFAMTVHKSQGSEFERVLLCLPSEESPVVTRELLYTGATRASRAVEVWWREPALRAAITRRIERSSGLRDALAAR